MSVIFSALIVAAAVAWSGWRIAQGLMSQRAGLDHTVQLLEIFAPAVAGAANDPRLLLAWQPVARMARQLYPKEFSTIDAAYGHAFPFSTEQIERAHARWTADWLAWERAHDAECKLKVSMLEHELGADLGSTYGRARLEAIEREKLDRYQQHYEEYLRVGKGLQALIDRR